MPGRLAVAAALFALSWPAAVDAQAPAAGRPQLSNAVRQ